jgi:hypothetical protein
MKTLGASIFLLFMLGVVGLALYACHHAYFG